MVEYTVDDWATSRDGITPGRTRIREMPLWCMLDIDTVGTLRARYAREIASIRRARADAFMRTLLEREPAA